MDKCTFAVGEYCLQFWRTELKWSGERPRKPVTLSNSVARILTSSQRTLACVIISQTGYGNQCVSQQPVEHVKETSLVSSGITTISVAAWLRLSLICAKYGAYDVAFLESLVTWSFYGRYRVWFLVSRCRCQLCWQWFIHYGSTATTAWADLNLVKVKNPWSFTSSDTIRFHGTTIMLRGNFALESM